MTTHHSHEINKLHDDDDDYYCYYYYCIVHKFKQAFVNPQNLYYRGYFKLETVIIIIIIPTHMH